MEEEVSKVRIVFVILGILLLTSIVGAFIAFRENKRPPPPPSKPTPQPTPTPTLPPPVETFDEVVAQLNTSQKLVDYLNKAFKLEEKEQIRPILPGEFFKNKKGTAWDFGVFASYVLWKNGFDAAIIRYRYNTKINCLVVFRDVDIPKTMIFIDKGVFIYPHGWSFEEMFKKEEERLGAKITEYSISYWTDNGELWPEEWKKR